MGRHRPRFPSFPALHIARAAYYREQMISWDRPSLARGEMGRAALIAAGACPSFPQQDKTGRRRAFHLGLHRQVRLKHGRLLSTYGGSVRGITRSNPEGALRSFLGPIVASGLSPNGNFQPEPGDTHTTNTHPTDSQHPTPTNTRRVPPYGHCLPNPTTNVVLLQAKPRRPQSPSLPSLAALALSLNNRARYRRTAPQEKGISPLHFQCFYCWPYRQAPAAESPLTDKFPAIPAVQAIHPCRWENRTQRLARHFVPSTPTSLFEGSRDAFFHCGIGTGFRRGRGHTRKRRNTSSRKSKGRCYGGARRTGCVEKSPNNFLSGKPFPLSGEPEWRLLPGRIPMRRQILLCDHVGPSNMQRESRMVSLRSNGRRSVAISVRQFPCLRACL
jgi:hypothetical protein